MNLEALPTQIGPGSASLVMIHYVDGKVGLRQEITELSMRNESALIASAKYAAEQTEEWTAAGRDVVLVVYDGVSGEWKLMAPIEHDAFSIPANWRWNW